MEDKRFATEQDPDTLEFLETDIMWLVYAVSTTSAQHFSQWKSSSSKVGGDQSPKRISDLIRHKYDVEKLKATESHPSCTP